MYYFDFEKSLEALHSNGHKLSPKVLLICVCCKTFLMSMPTFRMRLSCLSLSIPAVEQYWSSGRAFVLLFEKRL